MGVLFEVKPNMNSLMCCNYDVANGTFMCYFQQSFYYIFDTVAKRAWYVSTGGCIGGVWSRLG